MKKIVLSLAMMIPFPALAHQGDHAHFDWAGLISHVFETDHIVFAAIAVATGILAFRAGRRAEARAIKGKAIARRENQHDPR